MSTEKWQIGLKELRYKLEYAKEHPNVVTPYIDQLLDCLEIAEKSEECKMFEKMRMLKARRQDKIIGHWCGTLRRRNRTAKDDF